MSQMFYAVNIQNKTFYALKKGNWYKLTDLEAFQDVEYLAHEILTKVFRIDDQYWMNKDRENIVEEITNKLAPDLYKMMKNTNIDKIKIINDATDDLVCCKAKKYKCIGTRCDSEDYHQELQRLNRHLTKEWEHI